MSSLSPSSLSSQELVVGTRLHLGNASEAPKDQYFHDLLKKFTNFASSCQAKHAYIAVDATPILPNYSLVDVVQAQLASIVATSNFGSVSFQVIPVTPWNAFVPALNAIASQAAQHGASLCLFCSVETQTSPDSIRFLIQQMEDEGDDILVAGAVLPGHSYQPNSIQRLNGVTTPWNTLAVWNVAKLTLTGFPLVADGLHKIPFTTQSVNDTFNDGKTATVQRVAPGVEEVSAIALLQHLLGPTHAKAKLIRLPDSVQWDQTFLDNPQRQEWHSRKMKSKVERPALHLKLMQLEDHGGVVEHC